MMFHPMAWNSYVFIVFALFLTFRVDAAMACACCDSYKVTHVKKNDQLTVREGPGQDFKSIAWLHHDESCIHKTSECKGQWCKIEFGTIKGWVHTYYLSKVSSLPQTSRTE